MHIDAIIVPGDQKNSAKITSDKILVIIDILRVSSTIITALTNGAKNIYPVSTIKRAFALKKELILRGISEDDILLCGERNGVKVKGFDIGNSPETYTPELVKDKNLIISSTNGTKAINRCRDSYAAVTASFLNGSACANFILKENRDTIFYLSGRLGTFSYEDAAGAGFIISKILENSKSKNIDMSDAAKMCLELYNVNKEDILKLFKDVFHGKYLEKIGLGKDLKYCSNTDSSTIIPILSSNGCIISG